MRRGDAPGDVLERLRLVCLDLPNAVEERAWVGTRWVVRKKNFAQVLQVEAAWPPAYVKALGRPGPACVLTFRLEPANLRVARYARAPFFRPGWFDDLGALTLDEHTDWDEVEVLLVESYAVLAPKRWAAQVGRGERQNR